MGEVQIQNSQQEPMVSKSPRPTTITSGHKQKQPIVNTLPNYPSSSSMIDQIQSQQEPIRNNGADQYSLVEPTDQFSMLHLNSSNTTTNRRRQQLPFTAATNNNNSNSSGKRRSPPSSSSVQRSPKKLFCDQEDLTHHGFSAITLPLSLGTTLGRNGPVLRRCVSDPCNLPAPAPENSTPPQPTRGSGLPPLHPSLRRCLSDVTSSPAKASPRSVSSEETTPDSMKLRRMKDRMREMRLWWDEIMKEEEEGEEEGEEEYCAVAEDDKVLSQFENLGGDSEEAVNVEWAEKCVSLTFRCPCGKGYEVLISEKNCYYKLL